jgi:hypothetical protein
MSVSCAHACEQDSSGSWLSDQLSGENDVRAALGIMRLCTAEQAEILWLMAAKTKWQESEARKQESEAALKTGDEKLAAQLLARSQELLGAARGILYSANIANPGMALGLSAPCAHWQHQGNCSSLSFAHIADLVLAPCSLLTGRTQSQHPLARPSCQYWRWRVRALLCSSMGKGAIATGHQLLTCNGRSGLCLSSFQPKSSGTPSADSEQIWLAAFKIEFENSEMGRARGILAKARATLANERIWMKSALVERERGDTEEVSSHMCICTLRGMPRDFLITPLKTVRRHGLCIRGGCCGGPLAFISPAAVLLLL